MYKKWGKSRHVNLKLTWKFQDQNYKWDEPLLAMEEPGDMQENITGMILRYRTRKVVLKAKKAWVQNEGQHRGVEECDRV